MYKRRSQYSLGDEELEVIDTGGVAVAEASDLERPENRFDGGHGPLLEVYLPVWTPGDAVQVTRRSSTGLATVPSAIAQTGLAIATHFADTRAALTEKEFA